ncbi:MAG: uncharacterized membrane protein YraQ (UPF0718 family) [Planctomycetota bacterium]
MSILTDILTDILGETWDLVAEAAPWLFIGFLCAGLLKVFLPAGLIARQLGANSLRSVFLAALYGAPIPLCSCSVIPTASALRRAGASKGATTSFLISTPETGIDSVSVTYALLGPWMTLMRPLAALASAVLTGGAVNLLAKRQSARGVEATGSSYQPEESCCPTEPGDEPGHSHGTEAPPESSPENTGLLHRCITGARYAFVDLLDDLTPVLLVGLLISGLIATLVPAEFFGESVPSGLPAMLMMLLIGTPMYVCATASTPIAAVLIAKGLDPGAALVFLLVGPATNLTTLMVVGRMLGRGVLLLYLAGVVGVALAAGIGANLIYGRMDVDLGEAVAAGLQEEHGILSVVFGALLLLALGSSAIRIRMDRILIGWIRKILGFLGIGKAKANVGGTLVLLCGLLVAAGTSSCITSTEHEVSSNSGARSIRRAEPTTAWEVVLDGETFGRVIRFDVEGWPGETRFVVQNPYGQDMGMVDALGRAFRYVPHRPALWVASGTVPEGTAAILKLTGNLELQEVALTDSIQAVPAPESPIGEDHGEQ